MSTYNINPTYYRVTWDQASPTDYTGLTGSSAGGVDYTSAFDYNRRISVTGTVDATTPVLADGDSMIINNHIVAFAVTDVLEDIIAKINLAVVLTNVIAYPTGDYVTLTNAAGSEGEIIDIAEGTGALAKLGFTAGAYRYHPSVMGGVFTTFTNLDTFKINGVIVTMTTAGGLDPAGAVSTINLLTNTTGVVAYLAADTVQLASINGQPFTLAGTTIAKLGFTAGVYGGYPGTLTQSMEKNMANSRWLMVVNQLEQFSTPFMLGDVLGTGNYDGSAPLTTLSFTVGYEHPDQISTFDELNPGATLTGTAAIRRAVARGLTASYTANAKVFDPTMVTRGDYAIRPNSVRIVVVTTDGIDSVDNIDTVEGNISVEMIAYA